MLKTCAEVKVLIWEREASQRWQEAAEAKHRQEMAEMKAQVATLEAKAQAQKERASAAAAHELRKRAAMNSAGESATYEARPALSRRGKVPQQGPRPTHPAARRRRRWPR